MQALGSKGPIGSLRVDEDSPGSCSGRVPSYRQVLFDKLPRTYLGDEAAYSPGPLIERFAWTVLQN